MVEGILAIAPRIILAQSQSHNWILGYASGSCFKSIWRNQHWSKQSGRNQLTKWNKNKESDSNENYHHMIVQIIIFFPPINRKYQSPKSLSSIVCVVSNAIFVWFLYRQKNFVCRKKLPPCTEFESLKYDLKCYLPKVSTVVNSDPYQIQIVCARFYFNKLE